MLFTMAEKFCKALLLSLNLLDKAENFVLFFLLFIIANKKIHLYIKASAFQFGPGTSRHKYERSLAVYNTCNKSCIPVCKIKSKCCSWSKSQEEV